MNKEKLPLDNQDELLQYAINNGILDLQYIQKQIDMDKRKKILSEHPYDLIYNKKRGRWFTRFLVDGEYVQRHRATKDELEDLIVDYYKNNCKFDNEPEEIKYPFTKAYDRWIEAQEEYGKHPNTIYKYTSDWCRFFVKTDFAYKELTAITTKDIEMFMIERIKTLNLKRQAGVMLYGYISGVFYNAVMDRIIPRNENPCDLVDKKKFSRFYNRSEKPQVMRVLSHDEIKRLIDKLNTDVRERPESLYAYGVRLSLLTGMRSGEICGLRWCNVDENEIRICESEKFNQKDRVYYMSTTKTDKERTLPITDGLREFFNDMKELQSKYGITDDFVISTRSGKLHTRNLSDYMIKTSKKLGFEISKNIHAIRRTFNSYMRSDGVSATLAGSIIGNSPEVNTNHYTYDICDTNTKKNLVTSVEQRMLKDFSFAKTGT